MITITKERLLTIQQWRETYGPGSNVVLPAEEAEELARIALASLEAKPIGAFHIAEQQVDGTSDYLKDGEWPIDNGIIEVYAAPPVPVVPEEKPMPNPLSMYAVDAVAAIAEVRGWNACRAAMLQGKSEQPQNAQQNIPENIPGGNSPVIPDGWISCSERMPDSNCLYLCWGTYFEGDEPGYIPAYFFVYQTNGWTEWQPVEDDCNPREVIITHWMPLPAAPKQEVK
ncbi:DUF551 domain-containing protein [Escherichia coli]|uniref:DUF551 domain-containing protein n=1 Tax=Escherichia coli TaxID=562 RepID=UPI0010B51842|nr:DUF551 domain-containing protein [Escherichia coli]GCK73611.1 hypothetical protein BvCmsF63A_00028 [Escherichia coli]